MQRLKLKLDSQLVKLLDVAHQFVNIEQLNRIDHSRALDQEKVVLVAVHFYTQKPVDVVERNQRYEIKKKTGFKVVHGCHLEVPNWGRFSNRYVLYKEGVNHHKTEEGFETDSYVNLPLGVLDEGSEVSVIVR